MDSAFYGSSTYQPDQLIAGELPLLSETVTLKAGQKLARGAVLGQITADKKYVLSVAAAEDGSETPTRILAQDADATGGDVKCLVYRRGDFNARALTLGAGHTVASVTPALESRHQFIISTSEA